MKKLSILLLSLSFIACKTTQKTQNTTFSIDETSAAYTQYINENDLKKHLYIIAADSMQGRNTGEIGQQKARDYIVTYYKSIGIAPPKTMQSYFQQVPSAFMKSRFSPKLNDADNILAFIEGTDKKDEIIVISAHYDHVGMKNGEVYNGADDNGSGTVALLEMAEAFAKAVKMGHKPRRSVLFLHVIGEEHGLHGSRYYAENPVFPLANTIVDINIDMVGRIDDVYKTEGNYIYVIGADRLSTELHQINEEINTKFSNLKLDYTFNDVNDPNEYYYRSDHYNFAKKGIPSIFFFNGVHADYHQAGDEPQKILYPILAKRTQHFFRLAWQLANQEKRIVADKK